MSSRLSLLRVRPLAGNRARGWLTAGPFRVPCALGPAGIVRIKREGDKGTPAGRFRLLWGYCRPDRVRLRSAGAPLKPMRRDQGWCEDPSKVRATIARCGCPPPIARTGCGATIIFMI